MRADRLISLMMLLQNHGKMTAHELAVELEVSERTIYRDIDALGIAGVPVYADRGPGGGCGLLHDYRLRLTGLTDAEIRAFFMLRIPTTLAALGADREAQSALLKIAAALPGDHRVDAARIRQRIHMDPAPWFQTVVPPPTLQIIYQALWTDRKLWLRYQMRFGSIGERLVNPYGLVAKGDKWYLVYGWQASSRVLGVDTVLNAEIVDEACSRPADFDLARFWERWAAVVEASQPEFSATLRIEFKLIGMVAQSLGVNVAELLAQATPPDVNGQVTIRVRFTSFEDARMHILGWGRAVEVMEPHALRLSVVDFAAQIVAHYAGE